MEDGNQSIDRLFTLLGSVWKSYVFVHFISIKRAHLTKFLTKKIQNQSEIELVKCKD